MVDRHDYFACLLPALLAAREAGKAILEVYQSDFAVEVKEDCSPLTKADRLSNTIIAGTLSSSSPCRLPILSEEGRAIAYEERSGWDYFWLIDPLDGTKEFIKRNGEFTVNIALIEKGSPVLGIVHIPVSNSFYFGAKGLGAFMLDDERSEPVLDKAERMPEDCSNPGAVRELLRDSVPLPLEQPAARPFTAVGSRSHMSPETREYIEALQRQHGEIEIVSAGSSLKFCLVASGRADVYPRFAPTMEWDTAAGQVIVEASGGEVLQWGAETALRYNKEDLVNPWFIASLCSVGQGQKNEDEG